MRSFNIIVVFLLFFIACNGQETKIEDSKAELMEVEFQSFGEKIAPSGSISSQEMVEKFDALALTDTLTTKFTARVTDVCQAKGCWMKLQLQDGKEAMVRFKDYGFFMPKDIKGTEVIVNGKAFVEVMSVEKQRHFAKDGSKSESEIAKITASKKTYSFEADGVLLKH